MHKESLEQKDMVRYKQLFNIVSEAFIKTDASPTECLMTLSVMSEALMSIRISEPKRFLDSSLKEVLGSFEE